eukprot:1153350-Pelagomonas_calceolata.AAC.1
MHTHMFSSTCVRLNFTLINNSSSVMVPFNSHGPDPFFQFFLALSATALFAHYRLCVLAAFLGLDPAREVPMVHSDALYWSLNSSPSAACSLTVKPTYSPSPFTFSSHLASQCIAPLHAVAPEGLGKSVPLQQGPARGVCRP